MQQWPAAFFNGTFQQTTKTNPQKISVAFFGFHDAQESRFFRPSISPKLAPRRHAIFFSVDESRHGAVREDIPAGWHLETKMASWKHSMVVYLRKAFFLLILKGNNKKSKTHPFRLGCLVGIGSENFPRWIFRDYMFHSCHSFRSCQIH